MPNIFFHFTPFKTVDFCELLNEMNFKDVGVKCKETH